MGQKTNPISNRLGIIKGWDSNWYGGKDFSAKIVEDNALFVSEVKVDSGRVLKRLRTAPQGRGYRMQKRSNHVTLVVDKMQIVTQTQTK